ncbi:MAG: histidine kinase [Saprospiraceae bacterium]
MKKLNTLNISKIKLLQCTIWLVLFILSQKTAAQWVKKTNIPCQEVISFFQSATNELSFYCPDGKYSYDGAYVEKTENLHCNLVKNIAGQFWILNESSLLNSDSGTKITFSKITYPIIDFTYFEEKWYFLTSDFLYRLQGYDLIPETLKMNDYGKHLAFRVIDESLEIISTEGIVRMRKNQITTKISYKNAISKAFCTDNKLLLYSPDSIFIYSESQLKPLNLSILSSNEEIISVTNILDKIAYLTERKIYFLDNSTTIELPKKTTNPLCISDEVGNIWLIENGEFFLHTFQFTSLPTVNIERILVDGTMYDFRNETLNIKNSKSTVRIFPKITNLTSSSEIQMSHYLDGYEKDWSPPSKTQEITYQDLPSGKYVFRLRAKTFKSDYQYANPVKVEIQNESFENVLWMMVGFLAILLLSSIISLVIFYQRERKTREKRKMMELELNFLKEKEKVLQLQMNPHFMSNVLNNISGMVAIQDKENARKYLRIFSKFMREMLEQNSLEKISLKEEIVYLDSYLQLEKMLNEPNFNYSFEVTQNVNAESIKIKPMLVQPLIENAIKHGVKNRNQEDGHVSIIIEKVDKSLLSIKVIDNGRGLKNTQNDHHKSLSLTIVKERIGHDGDLKINNRTDGISGVEASLTIKI